MTSLFKKCTLVLILLISVSFIFNSQVQASINFKEFNVRDFSVQPLSEDQLVEEIQAFAFRILPEIQACKDRGELDFQDFYCTNIYEADRIRLSLLMGLNANLNQSIPNDRNYVRRLIYLSSITVTQDPTIIHRHHYTDQNNGFPNKLAFSLVDDNELRYVTKNSNYHFTYSLDAALKSCALGDEVSFTKIRLNTLNPQIKGTNTPLESTTTSDMPVIGCNDLILTIRQFFREDNIRLFLKNNPETPWLNFSSVEKKFFTLSASEKAQANSLTSSDAQYENIRSKCILTGILALAICPPMRTLSGLSQAGLGLIDRRMVFDANYLNPETLSGQVLYHSWQSFRNIANIILVIVFLLMIAAYITNFKLDNYQLRKLLPKMIVIVILINASFILLQFATDLSNIVGVGLHDLFKRLAFYQYDISSTTAATLSGTSIAATSVTTILGLSMTVGILVLIPIVVFVALSVITIIIMLAFRDGAVIVLMILAPIAIISLLLPNSNRFFEIWKKTIFSVLLIPILVGLTFGVGFFVSRLFFEMGGMMKIISFLPLAGQFYLLPKILLASINNLPLIGSKLGSTLNKVPGLASEKYSESAFHTAWNQNYQANRRRKISSASWKKSANWRDSIRQNLPQMPYLARNKANQFSGKLFGKFVPGYEALNVAPPFDPEVMKEIEELSQDIDPGIANTYLKKILDPSHDNPNLSANATHTVNSMLAKKDPNQIISALLTSSDDGEFEPQQLIQIFQAYTKRGGDEVYIKNLLEKFERNYQKEGKYRSAAVLNKINQEITDSSTKTSLSDALTKYQNIQSLSSDGKLSDTNDLIDLTSIYLNSVTNWSKFKPNVNKDRVIFDKLASTTSGLKTIERIRQQVSQQPTTLDFLKKYR